MNKIQRKMLVGNLVGHLMGHLVGNLGGQLMGNLVGNLTIISVMELFRVLRQGVCGFP